MRTKEFRIVGAGRRIPVGLPLVDEAPDYTLLHVASYVAIFSVSFSFMGRHLVYGASDAHTAKLNRREAVINTEKAKIMLAHGTSLTGARAFVVECTADVFLKKKKFTAKSKESDTRERITHPSFLWRRSVKE